MTEKVTREVGYHCQGKDKSRVLTVSFAPGEFIFRLLVGFSEERSEAMEIHTNLRKHNLGDIYESMYVADVDFSETDLAIVGLSTVFTSVCLTELSVYAAPVMSKASFVPLVKLNAEGISPTFVPEAYFKSKLLEKEIKRDKKVIKDIFTHTKVLRRASTNFVPNFAELK